MTCERDEARELASREYAFPKRGCRRRLAIREFEGGYVGIVLHEVSDTISMHLAAEGLPVRKTYVSKPNGKHSCWIIALDGLNAARARHRTVVGKAKIGAVIDWAIEHGISATLWAEGGLPAVIESVALSERPAVVITSPFDAIREYDENGVEFWSARRLMGPLGYSSWQNFKEAIDRARISCKCSGQDDFHHFIDANKVIVGGRWGKTTVDDIRLTRYACYLVALNGDVRKDAIANAQQYFVTQTRKAELAGATDSTVYQPAPIDFAAKLVEVSTALRALDRKIEDAFDVTSRNFTKVTDSLDARLTRAERTLYAKAINPQAPAILPMTRTKRPKGVRFVAPWRWAQKHGHPPIPNHGEISKFLSEYCKANRIDYKRGQHENEAGDGYVNGYPESVLAKFDHHFADFAGTRHERLNYCPWLPDYMDPPTQGSLFG